jgi:hypothetical protein
MPEMIEWKGETIGIFIQGKFSPEKTRFITTPKEPLQCGIGVFKKGSAVEPHRHVGDPAVISEFQEFIMIRRGQAVAKVYSPEGEMIRQITMQVGDSLLLLRGGHSFNFEEDTELLEVKQGPYLGREKMKSLL